MDSVLAPLAVAGALAGAATPAGAVCAAAAGAASEVCALTSAGAAAPSKAKEIATLLTQREKAMRTGRSFQGICKWRSW
ncbi:MAG: hypothetical protein Fur0019_12870 [Tibeticola sp.]